MKSEVPKTAVVEEEVVLSLDVDAPSSLLAQEIIVKLKQEIRKTYKNFFIFSSIPKVKYYWIGEPSTYHDLGVFYKNWGFYLEGVLLCRISGGLLTGDDMTDFEISIRV